MVSGCICLRSFMCPADWFGDVAHIGSGTGGRHRAATAEIPVAYLKDRADSGRAGRAYLRQPRATLDR